MWDSEMGERKRVLFLCTGNSARSQMAEGLVNHFLGTQWEAHSAGTRPAGYVHPLAIKVMGELGIDISRQRSKPTEEVLDRQFEVVITLCDGAAEECPFWPGTGQTAHVGFADPAAVSGDEETRLAAFRRVRDGIRRRVLSYLTDMLQAPHAC